MTLQGHPRSLILAPIENAYMTSHLTSIVTFVVSCRVSEIGPRLIRVKGCGGSYRRLSRGVPHTVKGFGEKVVEKGSRGVLIIDTNQFDKLLHIPHDW